MSEVVPVAVVGAGPVGLVSALCLARRGIPVLVLEAGPPHTDRHWRGSTLHPPTIQILAALGLAEPVLAGAVHVSRVQYRDLELDEVAELDYRVLASGTSYAERLQYEQYKLLRLLRAAADSSGRIEVRYGHAVRGVRQSDGGVVLSVETPNGTADVDARWVVGADGSHSTVRTRLGIGFPGTTFERPSIVAATALELADYIEDLAPVSYWSGAGGRLSLIRTPDVWRLALTVERVPDGGAGGIGYGSVDEPHPRLTGLIYELLGERAAAKAYPLLQHEVYTSHQRVAESLRAGRILLVGDAAHISATTGGMGLNSGIHDAWAVAAAIADGIDGPADHPAIEAYARLRRTTALQVVQRATTANRDAADVDTRSARVARIESLRATFADPVAHRKFAERAAMLDAIDGLHLECDRPPQRLR